MTDRAPDLRRALADHVDAAWDAVVRGDPPQPDPLAPELTAEARRLHALDRTPPADPAFLARLRVELTMPTPTPLPLPPAAPWRSPLAPTTPNGRIPAFQPPPLPVRRRPRRWWSAVKRVIAAVLVLGLLGGYVALNRSASGPSDEAEAARLFLVDDNRQRLTPIDPWTLADLPAATPIALDETSATGAAWEDRPDGWSLSADGSTFVGFAWPNRSFDSPALSDRFDAEDISLIFLDGGDGRERARVHPPAPVWNVYRLSGDGSHLLLQRGQIYFRDNAPDLANPQEWFVVDTADGRLVTTIVADDPGPLAGGYHEAWLSPDGGRVYRLITADTPSESGPGTLRLVAHNASTGAEVGRLDLPDVRAGMRTTERPSDDRSITDHVLVAHAFSPDGRRLALVHDGGTSVTLIDTDRLAIDHTVAVSPPSDPGQAFGPPTTPLPISDEEDEPSEQGRVLWAVFTAAGDGLYVGGWEARIEESGGHSCRTLETRRVDPETGSILARASSLTIMAPLLVSSAGESVYSLDDRTEACSLAFNGRQILRRLDARTLDVLAERELLGHVDVKLAPRVVDN